MKVMNNMVGVIEFLRKNIVISVIIVFFAMFSVAAHADTVDGGYVEKDDVRAVQYEFMLSKGAFSDNGYVDVYLYIPKYLDMQSNEFNMSIYNDEPIISIGNEFVDRVEYFISKDDVDSRGSKISK